MGCVIEYMIHIFLVSRFYYRTMKTVLDSRKLSTLYFPFRLFTNLFWKIKFDEIPYGRLLYQKKKFCWSFLEKTDDEDILVQRLPLYSQFQKLFLFVSNKSKGWISKRLFQQSKAHQIFRKTNISYPLTCTRTCAYQGVRNVRFFENLACFVFLKHLFEIRPFALLPTFWTFAVRLYFTSCPLLT